VAPSDPDHAIRAAAVDHARLLVDRFDDLVPLTELRKGFNLAGKRVSFGSFQKGIHRSSLQNGPAALTLTTSFKDPYGDAAAPGGGFYYAYRTGSVDLSDNRALLAAGDLSVPVIYFRAVVPGQYLVSAPMFVVADDRTQRRVIIEAGLPMQDMSAEGLISGPGVRRYATTDVRRRLHQQRFRWQVLAAYRHRCAVCSLREQSLIEAAHIVRDVDPDGIAAVVNGIALCAIHHLAYDRNVMGIDPEGVVHIARRLLLETDGPMLREGLQGVHGTALGRPRRAEHQPDPVRLAARFEDFERLAT
jgi:putative restriction endonuclease